MTEPVVNKVELHYEQRRRYRSIARRVLILLSAGVLVWSLTLLVPRAVRTARAMYYQKQCLKFSAPPNSVVFDSDQPQINSAATSVFATHSAEMSRSALIFDVVFLHQRSNGGGQRLVMVSTNSPVGLLPNLAYQLHTTVFEPTPLGSLHQIKQTPSSILLFRVESETHVKLFAGQPDPADASHFTIRFERDGVEGIIDGYLKSDDTVILEERSPTTQP